MRVIIFLLLLTAAMQAQDMNKLTIDEKSEKPMLIGHCTRDAFADTSFAWWFNSNYDMYEINEAVIDELNPNPDEITITVVLGTWCGDSKREFPRFLRIMDLIGFPMKNIDIIAVNRAKVTEGDDVKDLDIQFVPTFIVYKNQVEIGRIIETPSATIEEDLVTILKK